VGSEHREDGEMFQMKNKVSPSVYEGVSKTTSLRKPTSSITNTGLRAPIGKIEDWETQKLTWSTSSGGSSQIKKEHGIGATALNKSRYTQDVEGARGILSRHRTMNQLIGTLHRQIGEPKTRRESRATRKVNLESPSGGKETAPRKDAGFQEREMPPRNGRGGWKRGGGGGGGFCVFFFVV